jgi:hypothetical protein
VFVFSVSGIGPARLATRHTAGREIFKPHDATAFTAAHTQARPRGTSQRRIEPQRAA